MRCDAKPCPTFAHERPRLPHIELLQRTQPAVHDLETVPGDARAEVASLEQGDRQPPARRIPCDAGSDDAAAHEQHVERDISEQIQSSSHAPSYHLRVGTERRTPRGPRIAPSIR